MADTENDLQLNEEQGANVITIDPDRCTRCESCVGICVRQIYESTGDNIP